jgi:hypothetical protein
VGLRAGLEGCGKSRSPHGFDPRTAQPVVSRYTDELSEPTFSVEKLKIKSLFLGKYN